MNVRAALLVVTLMGGGCASATAQEPDLVTWDTAWGKVTYASESGGSGIFEYPVPFGDNHGYLYIDGLAGEFGGPGPLKGYRSEPEVSHEICIIRARLSRRVSRAADVVTARWQ